MVKEARLEGKKGKDCGKLFEETYDPYRFEDTTEDEFSSEDEVDKKDSGVKA